MSEEIRLDRRLRDLARRQRGVVSRAQLRALGFSEGEVESRLERGILTPVHRCVYAFGAPELELLGRCTAALLALGPAAAISHRSAAELHRLLPEADPVTHALTLTGRGGLRPTGLHAHRVRTIPRSQVLLRHGLRTTTVPRTLLDLAETETRATLRRALNEALYLRVTSAPQIERLLAAARGRRGALRLRTLLPTSGRAHSPLEDLFLPLIAKAGLPRPESNYDIGEWNVDAVWLPQRVAVELDSWGAHGTRTAFERDRIKGNAIEAAGFTLLRFTYDRLVGDGLGVVAEVAAALARYSAASSHQ